MMPEIFARAVVDGVSGSVDERCWESKECRRQKVGE